MVGGVEETFLSALGDEGRTELRSLGRVQWFRPGALLVHQGESRAAVVLLFDGRVKVTVLTPSGREVLLAVEGPGAVLGELSALDEGRCSASVTAVDRVEAVVVAGRAFQEFVRDRPEAAGALLELLGRRLRDSDRKRVEFAARDTLGRVSSRLTELADRFGEPQPDGGVSIDLTLSQEELAGWVGASREATVKALRRLRELGWVQTGRRQILVSELDKLRAHAESE